MKSIKKCRVVAFVLITFCGNLFAKSKVTNECISLIDGIEEKIYGILYERKGGDPINASLSLLDKAFDSSCKFTNTELALNADLLGEISRRSYEISKDEEFFNSAISMYDKALSIDPSRNEFVYLHKAWLFHTAGKFNEAISYINKGIHLDPIPKNIMQYYQTALALAVDTKAWDDAKQVMLAMQRKDERYYADVNVLYSSVSVLCHYERYSDAHIAVDNVEKYVDLKEADKPILEMTKQLLNSCEKRARTI